MKKARSAGTRQGFWMFAAFAIMAVIVAGCAAGRYGRFQLDQGIGRDFREGIVHPGYQYYYAGRDHLPYAILAVDKSYTLVSRVWVAFEPFPEQLEKMSAVLFAEDRYPARGERILSPDGALLGFWYAGVRDYSVRMDPEKRTIQVLFSNPELEEEDIRAGVFIGLSL